MNTKNIKKVAFFLLFFSSFLIKAQIGTTCENPINIIHSDSFSVNKYEIQTNSTWLKFTASTNYMYFKIFCYERDLNIVLYNADCDNLQEINSSNIKDIVEDNLITGESYLLKLETDTIGLTIDALFTSRQSSELDCSQSVFSECNKIHNNDFQLGSYNFVGGVDIDAFNSDITSWGTLTYANLVEMNGEHVAQLGVSGSTT